MSTKPQASYAAGTAKDDMYSPGFVVEPLLPYLPKMRPIWEPAVGAGLLAATLEGFGYSVVRSGFVTSAVDNGENFLANYRPGVFTGHPPIQVTNPPFSEKVAWFAKSLENRDPFAILVQDDTLALGGIQRLFENLRPQPGLIWFSPRVAFRTPGKKFVPGEGWAWLEDDPSKERYGKLVRSSAQFGTVWITWKLGFSGNVYAPQPHWGQAYATAWQRWHEGDGPFPGLHPHVEAACAWRIQCARKLGDA